MTAQDIDPADLMDTIRRLTTPKRAYDADEELMVAGAFVAEYGSFGQLFDEPDLSRARHWSGDRSAAWWMLGHWSVQRGDPNPPDEHFEHADECGICAFLEAVAVRREEFPPYGCLDCALALHDHDISPDPEGGEPIVTCKSVWTRAEPYVGPGGDVTEDQTSDAFSARWFARTTRGEWALISRVYYRAPAAEEDVMASPGDEDMYCQVEYLVCTDLADPGGTELNSEYVTVTLAEPVSWDPKELALQAPEPITGEWHSNAPQAHTYVGLVTTVDELA